MMVATVLEPDLEQIRNAIEALTPIADAFEIRFDACTSPVEPAEVRKLTDKTLIGTVRRKPEGGAYTGPEMERLELLEKCLQGGFQHIDVEGPTTVPGPEEQMIRSRHDFRATPGLSNLLRMAEEITRNGATFKLASQVHNFGDTLRLLVACRTLHHKSVDFAIMGLGEFPRALTHLLGSKFVYGGGRHNAPGQPSLLSVQRDLHHWGSPKAAARLYLVVGDPIQHSLSPRMHNAAFQHEHMDASYGALQVHDGLQLQILLETAAEHPLVDGLSVTAPLKDAAYELVEEHTPEAEAATAVNCVRIENGKPVGHNTDGLGAKHIVERLVEKDARILLCGTGGAARGILSQLRERNVTVGGRNGEKLRALERVYGTPTDTLTGAATHLRDFDLLINATRAIDPMPIDGYTGALFDLHYGHEATPWETYAAANKLRFGSGRDLLLEQGVLAFEFWTRKSAPRKAMEHAVNQK